MPEPAAHPVPRTAAWRRWALRGSLLAALVALAGCAAPQSGAARSPAAVAGPRGERLDESVVGTVVSVNPVLRYVVVDFPIRRMPVPDQRLDLYRQGQKVGTIRMTGPTLDTSMAADITAGEAAVGDEARER